MLDKILHRRSLKPGIHGPAEEVAQIADSHSVPQNITIDRSDESPASVVDQGQNSTNAHQPEPNTLPQNRQTQDDGANKSAHRKSLLHPKGILRKRSLSDSAHQPETGLEGVEGGVKQSTGSQLSSKPDLWKLIPPFGKAKRECVVATPGGNTQGTP